MGGFALAYCSPFFQKNGHSQRGSSEDDILLGFFEEVRTKMSYLVC